MDGLIQATKDGDQSKFQDFLGTENLDIDGEEEEDEEVEEGDEEVSKNDPFVYSLGKGNQHFFQGGGYFVYKFHFIFSYQLCKQNYAYLLV